MNTQAMIILLAAAGLAGCASGGDVARMEPVTPVEQFAIDVQSQPQTLQLAAHAQGASQRQAEAVSAFARQWVDQGGGEIEVRSPSRAGDPEAAYRTANDAREILVANGVPPAKVRLTAYEASAEAAGVVVLSYPRYVARGPACGKAWGDLAEVANNRPNGNLGCSVTANIAAQLADPADLLSPRDLDPPDATRRQTVIDNYRKGSTTSTVKEEQANGAVSSVVH
jgi:pilus assembly protein CpaD